MHLNIRQASKILSVSEKKVNQWIERGILRSDSVNHHSQLHRSDLLEQTCSREIDIRAEIFGPLDTKAGPELSLVDALGRGGVFRASGEADKPTVLRAMVGALAIPSTVDREAVAQVLLAREALGSTAIGQGIAIPHVRRPILLDGSRGSLSLFYFDRGIDFDAPDGQPVHAVFLLLSPTARIHLRLLSQLSFALYDERLRAALARQAQAAEVIQEVRRVELAGGQPGARAARVS
ncbi:MAG TPA: PTS sugar transporter subunit IIA [Candidatus Binataceae bacterium]|nr:PTS sugar transporter subunit IIA [Candidatus Binataceae bacterium]